MKTSLLLCSTLFLGAASAQIAPVSGKWQRQVWTGIPGLAVSNLTNSPNFYQAPDSTTLVDSSYASLGDNYGARTRGYITPAATGVYTFWVAGDDETQWSVSPTVSKWDARKLAGSSSATLEKSWDQSYSQRSAPRFMEAGQSYYVELLQKESTGGDHASVAWAMQGVDTGVLQNWASIDKGAVATASSNFGGLPPSNALDGNLDTFCHTNNTPNSWWMVDFRQDRLISSVELVNRKNVCQSRLSNFRVTVEDVNGEVVASQDFYQASGSVGAAETWTLPKTVAGRRVRIQFLGLNRDNNYYLHLAEVKAFGPNFTLKNWAHESSAVATASSVYSAIHYQNSSLIDGNVNTIIHTGNVAGSWVQVDLGEDRLVDSVELINRKDGAQNRLSNFRVSILDAADTVVLSQDRPTRSM